MLRVCVACARARVEFSAPRNTRLSQHGVGAPRWSWQHDVNRPCVIFERGLDSGGAARRNCEAAQTAGARRYRTEEQRGKLRAVSERASGICRKDSLGCVLRGWKVFLRRHANRHDESELRCFT